MKSLVIKMQELHASRLAYNLEKQKGATMLEYAILVGVIAVAAVAAGPIIQDMFGDVIEVATETAKEAATATTP